MVLLPPIVTPTVFLYAVMCMIFHFDFILAPDDEHEDIDQEEVDPNAGRFVRYQFTPQFLKLKTVGAT